MVSQVAYSSNQGLGVDQQTTKFQVKIRLLKNSYNNLIDETGQQYPFRPGMSATANIITHTEENVLSAPVQSVTLRDVDPGEKENEKEVVFVVENNMVKRVEVETGIQDDEFIWIKTGLSTGQEVVSAPFKAISKELKDKKEVVVVEEEELFK